MHPNLFTDLIHSFFTDYNPVNGSESIQGSFELFSHVAFFLRRNRRGYPATPETTVFLESLLCGPQLMKAAYFPHYLWLSYGSLSDFGNV